MIINYNKDFSYEDNKNGVLVGLCYKGSDTNYYDIAGNKVSNYNGFTIIGSGAFFRKVRRNIESDKPTTKNIWGNI